MPHAMRKPPPEAIAFMCSEGIAMSNSGPLCVYAFIGLMGESAMQKPPPEAIAFVMLGKCDTPKEWSSTIAFIRVCGKSAIILLINPYIPRLLMNVKKK